MVTARTASESLGEHREAFEARNKDLKPNEENKGWKEQLNPFNAVLLADEVFAYIRDHHPTLTLGLFRHYCRAIVRAFNKQPTMGKCLTELSMYFGYPNFNVVIHVAGENGGEIPNLGYVVDRHDTREFYYGETGNGVPYILLPPQGTDVSAGVLLDWDKNQIEQLKLERKVARTMPLDELKAKVQSTPTFSKPEFTQVRKVIGRTLALAGVTDQNPEALLLEWIGYSSVAAFNNYPVLPNRNYLKN